MSYLTTWLGSFCLGKWLLKRFQKNQFSGLPLTLLMMAIGYVTLLLAGLIEDVITHDSIISFDHAFAHWMAITRQENWIAFFTWITSLGKNFMLWLTISLTLSALLVFKLTQWLLPLLTSVSSAVLLASLGKWFFARPRPIESLFVEHTYSFPSAHATLAVSLYGFIALILFIQSQRLFSKMMIVVLGSGLVLLMGLSRLVLGVHYVSDVLAGFLVGGLGWLFGLSIYLWQTSRSNADLIRLK